MLGLAEDGKGNLYVLESMLAAGYPGPAQVGTGMIVRVSRNGAVTTIASGLSFPSAMTMGPDGRLYVSNFGFAGPAGSGQILKVDLPCD